MGKIKFAEWMTLVPTIVMVILIFFLWIVTGFKVVLFYILIIVILLAIYILTYTLERAIFEYGEKDMKEDIELLKLEKEHSALLWGFVNGVGIAFLISGLPKIATNPLEAMMGIILLTAGNLIYDMFYFPRYALLVRKRKIDLMLKKK